ncbi:MAG TPA: MBL fold metallo-hydrolase [Burkholderiaceae bacterium]|nr:MBL fold metallo-hydrolase [Burkholderiaceae bacterium]
MTDRATRIGATARATPRRRSRLGLGDSARADYKPPQFSLEDLMRLPAPPPGKAFDNLYFMGSKWVSAWAIPTSAGIVVVDAMDNDEEAQRIVEGAMRTLGLDPAQIRTVVVTHGHGDHYGGANYLKQRFNARVAMSHPDWQMTETKLEFDSPLWGRPPKRDVALAEGDTVRLGDTAIEIIGTPGHTMGTISLLFPVREGSKTHQALLWGGTAFNFGKQPARLCTYFDSVERTRRIAADRGVDVFISNHNIYDQALDKLARTQADNPNPFVQGTQSVQRALTVMSECGRAVLASWEA